MAKLSIPPIAAPDQTAQPETVQLHKRVVGALQNLVSQINANPFTANPAGDTLDMGQNRITGVLNPASETDAVPLGYLKRAFKGGSPGRVTTGGGGTQNYEIVYFNPGDIATGTAAQYNVGAARVGAPIEANISALTPPTGQAIKVNFLVNGTATVLATDLTLPAGTSTVIAATNINAGVTFSHNDMVILVVNQTGSGVPGANVSVGLVVRRT